MDKRPRTKTLEELVEKLKDYRHQVELTVMDKCPFIIHVGALTVGTDAHGKVISQNVYYPTQFTQSAVDEILTMTFMNGKGDLVTPKVYSRVQWFRERLTELEETIGLLDNNSLNKSNGT